MIKKDLGGNCFLRSPKSQVHKGTT